MPLAAHSRIWIYQANRNFTQPEIEDISTMLQAFVSTWTAHEVSLAAGAEVLHDRFIVLAVDEQIAGASGCSIDKSVKVLKAIEEKYHVTLFDRMQVAYKKAEVIESAHLHDFETLLQSGELDENTLVFNNLIDTYGQLLAKWLVPVKHSWHARYLPVKVI